jgi:hypothetical protein
MRCGWSATPARATISLEACPRAGEPRRRRQGGGLSGAAHPRAPRQVPDHARAGDGRVHARIEDAIAARDALEREAAAARAAAGGAGAEAAAAAGGGRGL